MNQVITDRAARWLLTTAVAAMMLVARAGGAGAQDATAQAAPAAPAEKRQQARVWESAWRLSLGSEFDDNAFKLDPAQRADLEDGAARYGDMQSVADVVNVVRLRAERRGPGLGSRRLSLGVEAEYEAHTLNRRRSNATLGVFASQKLSRRDDLGLEASFTPSEFRRNYLARDGSYQAGMASTLEGRLEYERELLRGKRGRPELSTTVAILGGRRNYADFPWRNRSELGGEVDADLLLKKRLGLELSARWARASHSGEPEPVSTPGGIVVQTLERDFDEMELGAETSIRLGRRRLELGYEHRLRHYLASLSEDPVYGGREDTRRTYSASLDLFSTRHADLVLGGTYEDQTTFRPGRGDTGDEADFSRSTVFLRLEISR